MGFILFPPADRIEYFSKTAISEENRPEENPSQNWIVQFYFTRILSLRGLKILQQIRPDQYLCS